MKQVWETDDLVEYWTLLQSEVELPANKTGATGSGFAALLKFFQLEMRFPQSAAEIPPACVNYPAKQVKAAPEQFQNYARRGRTIHRMELFDSI